MQVKNYKRVKNKGTGQITISGKIVLTKDVLARNTANDGLEYSDARIKQPTHITLKKGTEVDYCGKDTRSGFYHTVTLQTPEGRFEASIEGNTKACPRCKSTYCQFRGEVAAPGYGWAYLCKACGRPFVAIGTATMEDAPLFTKADVL